MKKITVAILIIAAALTGCAPSNETTTRSMALVTAMQSWPDVLITPVTISGKKGEAATGVFLVPKEGKAPKPVVLALHGLTDMKESWIIPEGFSKGGSVTRRLLDRGFAVLAIDLPYHGTRLPDWASSEQKRLVLDQWASFYRKAYSEIERALDFLERRKDIDRNRIGLIGYSLGGMIAYSVANTDARVRALVTCVAPPDRDESYPGAPRDNIAYLENTPVLVIAATQDHNYPLEDAIWFFEQLPSRVKEFAQYESTHSLPFEYAERAADWFVRYLGR
jgi:dienelactone hydrolase